MEEGQRPQCPECSKKFSRIASLKAHIMLHEREESLMCPECGDEFPLQVCKQTNEISLIIVLELDTESSLKDCLSNPDIAA